MKWALKVAVLLTPAFPAFQALELAVRTSPLAEADTHTKLPPAFEWELVKYADPGKKKRVKKLYLPNQGFVFFKTQHKNKLIPLTWSRTKTISLRTYYLLYN